jgi:hypothetical protein
MYSQMLRRGLQIAPMGAVLGDHWRLKPSGTQSLVEHASEVALSLLPDWVGVE